MKTLGLWEAAKRGAMAQLVDLEIERKLLEKLIEKCDENLGAHSTPVQVHRSEKARAHHNGLHWTQRPENRGKVRKLLKKMRRAR